MRCKKTVLIFLRLGLVILLVAAIASAAYFCLGGILQNAMNEATYKAVYLPEQGYANELGVLDLEFESFPEHYGFPLLHNTKSSPINQEITLIEDVYNGFTVYASAFDPEDGYQRIFTYLVSIEGQDFEFGWLHIGIGTPRAIVRLAYCLDRKIDAEELAYSAKDYPDVDEGFYGENWSRILFCYDKYGKVQSMAYEMPAF